MSLQRQVSRSISQEAIDAHWMPFTANRDFKSAPRLITGAQGHYYRSADGREIYDSFSGLWTTGLGHCHPKIVEAIATQSATLDVAMGFQVGNDQAFALAERLVELAPPGFNKVFFANSGSEAADTALKIALAYHHAKGAEGRVRFVGRERGYHGVNFGGLSVGGIPANRAAFVANLLPHVDHLPHTHNLDHNAFSKGEPAWGTHLADVLTDICNDRGGSTIAAVMVEPVAGSTGVLPPPKGYLKRLKEICDQHGLLLIFDEVITAFGRLGSAFAANQFDVMPDIITTAKGLTNGAIPMGAVLLRDEIYNAICDGPLQLPEFFHGYTYSGHPVACAAGMAVLDIYEKGQLLTRAAKL
ncbi:MAG: aminotransferase class III-fold pyridoxal phosphate-dependent enzyme, partial [Pseudomonadota bacterium]